MAAAALGACRGDGKRGVVVIPVRGLREAGGEVIRIDRIDTRGDIREHHISATDAARTTCGLTIENVQAPLGNRKCKRCERIEAKRARSARQ